ncbi:MAG: endonuclease/exonuclease/phosphatase family protein [Elusimicrobiales bacterium]|nr:endonuclease/exonuclease/phosphatase family protein [Elusimicrobiales bacterium]
MRVKFLTINLHKGFSPLNRRFSLPALGECIHATGADVIFLQEAVGENVRKAAKYARWPTLPQHEYLAGAAGFDHVYGRNAVYAAGHHGNAIISRFPILLTERTDISTNRLEKRGSLYAVLELPGGRPLHALCVHLGLLRVSRVKQLSMIAGYLERHVPPDEPLAVAGDFNEWRKLRPDELETRLGMREAGHELHGRRLRTYPCAFPCFPLDRIYLRGFRVLEAKALHSGAWRNLSDHAAFYAEAETIEAL